MMGVKPKSSFESKFGHFIYSFKEIFKYTGRNMGDDKSDDLHEALVDTNMWHASQDIVSDVLASAMEAVEHKESCSLYSVTDKSVQWPTIEKFSTELGINKIDEFLQTWKRDPSWLYHIEFKSQNSDACNTIYKYEVKWSIPTQSYPIPQATASVYFTIYASKIKPPDSSVEITYVFEGTSFIHKPGKCEFQEEWLGDIIENKLEFIKTINF